MFTRTSHLHDTDPPQPAYCDRCDHPCWGFWYGDLLLCHRCGWDDLRTRGLTPDQYRLLDTIWDAEAPMAYPMASQLAAEHQSAVIRTIFVELPLLLLLSLALLACYPLIVAH